MSDTKRDDADGGMTVLDVLDFSALAGDFVQRALIEIKLGGKAYHVRVGCAELAAKIEDWNKTHPAPVPPTKLMAVQSKSAIGRELVAAGYKGRFPMPYDVPQLEDEGYQRACSDRWIALAWFVTSLCFPAIRDEKGRDLTNHDERVAYLRDVKKLTNADAARIFRAVSDLSSVQRVEQDEEVAGFFGEPSAAQGS
jgi:hypothetical protein